jgi:hypothetical protein
MAWIFFLCLRNLLRLVFIVISNGNGVSIVLHILVLIWQIIDPFVPMIRKYPLCVLLTQKPHHKINAVPYRRLRVQEFTLLNGRGAMLFEVYPGLLMMLCNLIRNETLDFIHGVFIDSVYSIKFMEQAEGLSGLEQGLVLT